MKVPDSVEEEIEDDLRSRRRDDATIDKTPLKERPDLVEQYERFLVGGVRDGTLRGKKVVLDTGHGAAYRIGPDAFRLLGADVVVIHDRPNGRNINEHSGALHPETLAKTVVKEKADFGVAFDGDADRAIFADDRGRIRDGDEILYLWAQRLKHDGRLTGNRVVTTVMSNFGFERQLAADGIELIRAQVGDKYVLEQMLAHKAILGGEQSGHIIDLTVHTTGDGIHTALVFGELLAGAGRPFSSLRTFDPMPQVLLNERVRSKPPLDSLPRFPEELRKAEAELGRDGRILVRYSGTENLVRVMVEGVDEGRINKIAKHLRDLLSAEIG
jgi:phosphoglucosamine mutase